MRYLGGKIRIAKSILPIILKDRTDEWYVEPFAGGMNVICHVRGNRIASDKHRYLIELFRAVQEGWKPPIFVTEGEYNSIRIYREDYPPELVGFVGFNSWGGKWFGGYPRGGKSRDWWLGANLGLIRQKFKLKGVNMLCSDYRELVIPPKSIVYCDPPYTNTEKYSVDFDPYYFWKWCRNLVKEGHKVFISECHAPDDFKCIWSRVTTEMMTDTTRLEKLFTYGE